jgi:hypothetical protein
MLSLGQAKALIAFAGKKPGIETASPTQSWGRPYRKS